MNYEQATQLIAVLEDIASEMRTQNEILREINANIVDYCGGA